MEKIKKFLRGLKAELKKIVWPTPKKTATGTATAIGVMLAFAVLLFGADQGFTALITSVLSLF